MLWIICGGQAISNPFTAKPLFLVESESSALLDSFVEKNKLKAYGIGYKKCFSVDVLRLPKKQLEAVK